MTPAIRVIQAFPAAGMTSATFRRSLFRRRAPGRRFQSHRRSTRNLPRIPRCVRAGAVGRVSEGWRNPWFTERHDDTRPVVTAGLTEVGFQLGLFIGTLHSGMGEQLRRPSSVSGPPWIMGVLCVLLCCGSIDTHKDRCSCSIGSFDYCWLAHWFLDRAWRRPIWQRLAH